MREYRENTEVWNYDFIFRLIVCKLEICFFKTKHS